MPRPHSKEFRDEVVAVARKGKAPLSEIAKDFGISESCLRNWLSKADVEDGRRPAMDGFAPSRQSPRPGSGPTAVIRSSDVLPNSALRDKSESAS